MKAIIKTQKPFRFYGYSTHDRIKYTYWILDHAYRYEYSPEFLAPHAQEWITLKQIAHESHN